MSRINLTLVFILSVMSCFGQNFPLDPQVKIGRLENGLTYYIHNNQYSDGKADLYVVYKVGAILEEDNENGMAHFLEHMAFNGSKNFPGNKLNEYLRSVGVGSNANTSLERTMYYLSGIPVEQEDVLDNCLLAAYDWSGYLNLDENAVENEKNIIREELRMFSVADFRIYEALKSDLIPDSKYSKRNVIGKEETFMNFTANQLRSFYKKWYRPDAQALIIVGDFNSEVIENKLVKLFKNIPVPANSQEYSEYEISNSTETLISTVKDNEITFSTFDIDFRHKPLSKEEKGNIDGFAHNYLVESIIAMTNERLENVISGSLGNLDEISASYGSFMGMNAEESFNISLKIGNDNIEESIRRFLTELYRIRQYGFTNAEYERAKLIITSQYENKFEEKDKIENVEYVEKYVDNFLAGNYIPGVELEYYILKDLLPQISIEMVNSYVKEMIPDENIALYIVSPEQKEIPQKEVLLTWFEDVKKSKLEPFVENTNNELLLASMPVAGKIVSENIDYKLGLVQYKLSNGATVVIKQTDFKNNEILFSATSPGGTSLFPETNIVNIKLYEEVIDLGGVGNFSKMDLQKKLAGKGINLIPTINIMAEGFKGSTMPNSLEELLQLVYLQFTSPRMDIDAFNSFIERKKKSLLNSDPESIFNNAVLNTIYAKSERMLPLTSEDLLKADYQQIVDWRNNRYLDASDFTFIFVGNINPETSKVLIENYLASLPSESRNESAAIVDVAIQPGHITNIFECKMENPQALIMELYSAKVELTPPNRVILDVLIEILNNSLMETIRLQEGGAYAIHVSGGISEYPKGQTTLQVIVPTKPGKEDHINSLIKLGIKKIASEGPNMDDLNQAVIKLSNKHDQDMKNNGYWISSIASYYATGVNNIEAYVDVLNSIRAEDIKTMIGKLTKEDNLIEVIMKGI